MMKREVMDRQFLLVAPLLATTSIWPFAANRARSSACSPCPPPPPSQVHTTFQRAKQRQRHVEHWTEKSASEG